MNEIKFCNNESMALRIIRFIKKEYEKRHNENDEDGVKKYIEALSMAEDALKMRTKEKVQTKNTKYNFYCPSCGKDLGLEREDISVYDMEPPKFCENCGKALDWR